MERIPVNIECPKVTPFPTLQVHQDEEREQRISMHLDRLTTAQRPRARRAALWDMEMEIAARSPRQVRKMEREMGLHRRGNGRLRKDI